MSSQNSVSLFQLSPLSSFVIPSSQFHTLATQASLEDVALEEARRLASKTLGKIMAIATCFNATRVVMHHGSRRFCILMLTWGTHGYHCARTTWHASGPSIASNCWKLLGQMRWHRLRPLACGKMWPPSSQGILHKVAMEMDDLYWPVPFASSTCSSAISAIPIILFRDHASRAWTRPALHRGECISMIPWHHRVSLLHHPKDLWRVVRWHVARQRSLNGWTMCGRIVKPGVWVRFDTVRG